MVSWHGIFLFFALTKHYAFVHFLFLVGVTFFFFFFSFVFFFWMDFSGLFIFLSYYMYTHVIRSFSGQYKFRLIFIFSFSCFISHFLNGLNIYTYCFQQIKCIIVPLGFLLFRGMVVRCICRWKCVCMYQYILSFLLCIACSFLIV